ncbi:SWF or SNF family helicase [Streptomyces sp. CNQ-509]|uniref:SWF or SNF family helicase n=1 Tax=Streptomyces sp. CNQ-509 TaxID=444103 RepID=UPI00062DD586|nr:SWF or SNF family helicase [Streptomyces sp. CNQ-509]AKH81214.1 SWF or SNF family helicase [Streptomyces sp. CNQ-509]
MMTEREELTFEALPPSRGRGFAHTWWGRAWQKALEDTVLDGTLLRRGRKHARAGAVGAVAVRPGRLTARVLGEDRTPYRTDVLVQQLDDADWERLLDTIADRAGHIAALLDRDMPPELDEDAAAAGVSLLPGIGDLQPECGCGEWDHCEHTAALSYLVARLLDADPFVLLLMRGRGEARLLADLQERSAARAEQEAGSAGSAVPAVAVGVRADEAYAAPPRPLPPAVGPVAEAGTPPVLTGGAEPAAGLDVAALEFLVADTAVRARRLLADALAPDHAGAPLPPELTESQDAVRMAATAKSAGPGDGSDADAGGAAARIAVRLARGSGRDRGGMERAVRAWRHGGAAGLAVLEDEWTPDPAALARATDQLAAAWDPDTRPRLRATGTRWTAVGRGAQLRYGPDGRWWPYRKEGTTWTPAGPPAPDPAAALAMVLEDA